MQKLSTKEILNQNINRVAPSKMKELVIVLHDVRSMHNVGAAFRNADAFGINKIVLSGFTPAPPRPEITKTAIGAEEYVEWESVTDITGEFNSLKDNGYVILGLEQTKESKLLPEFEVPYNKKICLVFGNEVTGLDDEVLSDIDQFIEIPQYGHKHSLNVSVTVGVTLYAFLQKFWSSNSS